MDQRLLLAIHNGWSHPWLDIFFAWISSSWFSIPVIATVLLILFGKYNKDGVKIMLVLTIVVFVGDYCGALLKDIFAQPRPCEDFQNLVRLPQTYFEVSCESPFSGMPSNHALNWFTAALFISLILRSWTWLASLGSMAFLVALSRVYLGVHYPSQVLAGATLGIAYGLLCASLVVKYFPMGKYHPQGDKSHSNS
ncbi:phosphatase PAP2 family protein [Kaarinaea lacus]